MAGRMKVTEGQLRCGAVASYKTRTMRDVDPLGAKLARSTL